MRAGDRHARVVTERECRSGSWYFV